MGLREQTLARTDRNEYDPKTKTGWKQVNGKLTFFKNGKVKNTGPVGIAGSTKNFFYELPGKVREQNRDTDTTPWHLQNQPNSILKPKEQAINWFKYNMELPELSDQTKRSLVEGALSMQASFDLEDSDRLTWNDAIDFGSEFDFEPILTQEQRNQIDRNELPADEFFGTKLPPDDEETKVNTGGVTKPEEIELNKDEDTPSQKRLRSAKDFDNKLKDQSTARQNWTDMTHFERTQAKAFARGNPLKEMRIKRAKSTFFDENT